MLTFTRSVALLRDALPTVQGGVNSHFRLGVRPEPLVISYGDGPCVIDVDRNRYVDYYLGMGPVILGHTAEEVADPVRREVGKGVLFAGQTEIEYAAAALVSEMVP